jgi:hypothetical protein
MPSEIRRELVITGTSGDYVFLEPASANLEAHPAIPAIDRIRVQTVESTPDATFWNESGCHHFEVIIRPKSA